MRRRLRRGEVSAEMGAGWGAPGMKVIDAVVARAVSWAAWLVIPVSLLLFLQWPLRDLVKAHTREANDLGQVLFALYVAVAVTAASRRGAHLAMDLAARAYGPSLRRTLLRLGLAVGIIPWAVFVLLAGRTLFTSSLLQREGFSDTGNPGYFLVKLSAALLAGLLLAQAVLDMVRPPASRGVHDADDRP
jgi:TRAP-type C4-dicarboxylate transport system permease small subunit